MDKVILGFDPGGKSGVAIGEARGDEIAVSCGTVDSVVLAFHWFAEHLKNRSPDAIGIDALLFWSTAAGGWRRADKILREKYPAVRASVICSARGSMAAQGMALAFQSRMQWPAAKLNEVHPKVLMHAVHPTLPYPREWPSGGSSGACKWLKDRGVVFVADPENEHEFDAALAVWITARGLSENLFDLVVLSKKAGGEHLLFPAGEVSYHWPTDLGVSH